MDLIDKIFVINLDERTDRLEYFSNQCSKHNIPKHKVERFSAINGETYLFKQEEITMFKNAIFNIKRLTPLIIKKKIMGNQLSHFNILLEMKKRNYNNIIIVQDDVIFKNNFVSYIEQIMNNIPDNSEIINLGMHKTAYYDFFEPYDLVNDIIDNDIINNKITDFVYSYNIYKKTTGNLVNPASLAYIVTKKGCINLLEHFYKNGFDYETDWNYNFYLQSKNIFYGSKYVLATGNNIFKSDIFVNSNNYLMEDLIDTNIYYTDKNTTHSYFNLYNNLFSSIREDSKNILEIGIGNFGNKNGGSLLLWNMFFKNAFIHGIDIISENQIYDIILTNKRIKTYLNTDAYNSKIIDYFKQNNLLFDVIIDDGPHTLETQCECIKLYSDLLSHNGILVIEDVQDISWIEKFKEITPIHLRKYIYVYDLRHIKNRYDDIVFVINKNKLNNDYLNDISIPLVLSYENDINHNNSIMFRKTLQQNSWDYLFIGQNTKWTGFKDRIIGYRNYLQSITDDKIVILSDSRDVFCLKSPENFIKNIKSITDKQIIISAEMFLQGQMNWSEKQIQESISKDPNYFWQGEPLDNYWKYLNKEYNLPFRKYLNAGLIIGKVSLLKKAFNWIIENNYNDDQLAFSRYTNYFPETVYLDYDAIFLQTSTGFVNGSLYNHSIQITDCPSFVELYRLSSYFLHIPGLPNSKGQKIVYDNIFKLFESNLIKNMFNIYNISHDLKTNIFITNDDNII